MDDELSRVRPRVKAPEAQRKIREIRYADRAVRRHRWHARLQRVLRGTHGEFEATRQRGRKSVDRRQATVAQWWRCRKREPEAILAQRKWRGAELPARGDCVARLAGLRSGAADRGGECGARQQRGADIHARSAGQDERRHDK